MSIDDLSAAGGATAARTRLLAPPHLALLEEPLEFIHADHFRQRSLCVALRRMGELGVAERNEADEIVSFMQRDLDLHHADEDADLFPALRRRALAVDELGPVLGRLSEDHIRTAPLVASIVAALSGRDDPVVLSPAVRKAMLTYAASEHRHLALENGIVLAIARIRLTRKDRLKISAAMKARRGIA
jgi:hemerythrin-like domain-containing protein